MTMNQLHQIIKDKVVQPMLRERMHPTKGTILFYDNQTNTATVEIPNITDQGKHRLTNVPVQTGSGGVHSAGPFVGDEVWVIFLGGNLFLPRIVSIADERYQDRTRARRFRHERKGAYIPDYISTR